MNYSQFDFEILSSFLIEPNNNKFKLVIIHVKSVSNLAGRSN